MSELKVNTISEVTGANGVVVDSVKLKDGGVIIADAGNIGSASDTDAIAIASGGGVTFSQAATFSSTIASTGAITSNAGVVVDNITIDGTEIDLSSGDLTLDVAGDIILDADGGDVKINDGGTAIAELTNSSTDFVIKSVTNDKDIIFKGVDNSSAITALTLDMSAAGAATFNNAITSGAVITSGAGLVIADTGNIGSASDTDAIAIAADGDVTFSQKVGIVSAHDLGTGLHIKTADSGASVSVHADELVIEGSANSGLSILSGNSSNGRIMFGDDGDNDIGYIEYDHSANQLALGANAASHLKIDSAGAVTMPLQPCFSVTHNVSQTNLTEEQQNTITFGNEIFDVNADFASNTFTAPVTGKYLLTTKILIAQIDHDATYYSNVTIKTSNRNYRNQYSVRDFFEAQPEFFVFTCTCIADMDASDTAIVEFGTYGPGASQEDVYGTDATHTQFMGQLIS